LCSQPTLSRLENAPRLRDVIRLTYTLVDAWMDSYWRSLTRAGSRALHDQKSALTIRRRATFPGRLWVNRDVLAVGRPLPVYPDKQTCAEFVGMSQTCPRKSRHLFDHLVGARSRAEEGRSPTWISLSPSL
jgi:hypothetical protein